MGSDCYIMHNSRKFGKSVIKFWEMNVIYLT